jgi:hypothetical protein
LYYIIVVKHKRPGTDGPDQAVQCVETLEERVVGVLGLGNSRRKGQVSVVWVAP